MGSAFRRGESSFRSSLPRHDMDSYEKDAKPLKPGRWSWRRLTFWAGMMTLMVWWIATAYQMRFPSRLGNECSLWSWDTFVPSLRLRAIGCNRHSTPRSDAKKHKYSYKDNEHLLPLVCTKSHLEELHTYPMYGCPELEEIREGPTEYLGSGHWRDVHLATYKGQKVALKLLRDEQEDSERNRQRHRWEAAALDAVKGHPNIVHILGLCNSDMITEFYPFYLDDLLFEQDEDDETPIPMHDVIRMSLDIARGMQALHEVQGGPIVHADLQPRQILLDEDLNVRINDLNRLRFMGRDPDGNPCPFIIHKGDGEWRSPEEFTKMPQTEKLDIYTMGYVFWAMLSREEPWEDVDDYQERVLNGGRPRVDPSWHKEYVQLFQDMWSGPPPDRPCAGEIVRRLEEMYAALPTSNKEAQSAS